MNVDRRRADTLAMVLLCAVAVLLHLPNLDQPLLEAHGFRQTQTAYTARLFHEEGIDLLHPKLPVLTEAREVPFEFPLFQAVASVPMSLGMAPDPALRATCLLFFLATAVALWALAGRLGGPIAAFLSLVLFLFSPLSLLWSRTAMIEYVPTAGAVVWLLGTMAWRDSRRWPSAAAALAGGTAAMLVKPSTAVFWVVPILLYRGGRRVRPDMVRIAVVAVPLLAAALWTRHTDAVKTADAATRWLTSGALTEWYFGRWEYRFDARLWSHVVDRLTGLVVGLPLWQLPLAVGAALTFRSRAVLAGLVVSAVAAVLVFFNLYWIHDYYLVAVTPQAAVVLGCGGAGLLRLARSLPVRRALAVALVVWLVALPLGGAGYWDSIYRTIDSADELTIGRELAAATGPEEGVVFDGFDWAPMVPYYAHREGVMLTPRTWSPELAEGLARRYSVLATTAFVPFTYRLLDRALWTSTPSPHVYYFSDRPADLRRGRLLATDDLGAMPGARATKVLATPNAEIPCDRVAPVTVPRGPRWTYIRFEKGHPDQAVHVEEARAAPMPADRLIVVPPDSGANGGLHVYCRGNATAVLTSVVDGPAPAGLSFG